MNLLDIPVRDVLLKFKAEHECKDWRDEHCHDHVEALVKAACKWLACELVKAKHDAEVDAWLAKPAV